MRCPYCESVNQDTATFCRRCGRELQRPLQPPVAHKEPAQQAPRSTRSDLPPPRRLPYPAPALSAPARAQVPSVAPATRQRPPAPSVTPPAAPIAEPPTPFPPQTLKQLRVLEQGALNYTLVSDDEQAERKRIVRVAYPPCAGWQQFATLFKALNVYKEQQGRQFTTVLIQGLTDAHSDLYSFNNGQLIFDRGVRLGSDVLNRYQLETGNGFTGDSIRTVLTEVVK
jgi:hypothetical protein